MLINIKMIDGTDLIGFTDQIAVAGTQKICNPLKIGYTSEGMIMTLFAVFADKSTVRIPQNQIIYVSLASDVAKEKYESVFNSEDDDDQSIYDNPYSNQIH